MWNIYGPLDASHSKYGYLHSTPTRKAARAFAGRWTGANPGRYCRIVKVGSGDLGTPDDRPAWIA